jgi:hypothetical protein
MILVDGIIFNDPVIKFDKFDLVVQGIDPQSAAGADYKAGKWTPRMRKRLDRTVGRPAESAVLNLDCDAASITTGSGPSYLAQYPRGQNNYGGSAEPEDIKAIEGSWELRSAVAKALRPLLVEAFPAKLRAMQDILPSRLWIKRHRIVELFCHESLMMPRITLSAERVGQVGKNFEYRVNLEYHVGLQFTMLNGEATMTRLPGWGRYNTIIASLQESIDKLESWGDDDNAREVGTILAEVELRAALHQLEEQGHDDLAEELATVVFGSNPIVHKGM